LIHFRRAFCLFSVLILVHCYGFSQAPHSANSNAIYQQLRVLTPGSDGFTVNNLVLHRDAATFTFSRGDIAFYGEVNGKVTGAVFKGAGHIHLTPPTPQERHNLQILNKSEEFDEDFDQVVLRFTDATAAELHKDAAGKSEPNSEYAKAAQDLHNFVRIKLKENLDLRILEDVLSPAQGGYFLAAIRGKKNSHLFFTVDPRGVPEVEPEEVALLNWNDWGGTYLTAFHAATDAARGGGKGNERNESCRIDNESLDVSIERNGFLTGLATVQLVAEREGVAVAPLALYPTLRVSRVETEKGEPLDFVQEKKDEDADFGVVLAQPLKRGESITLKISYGGKDVVRNEGGQNYYPIARESWYPNSSSGLGDYASYHMFFHVPKGLELIATGTKVNESNDGKITTTEWKTDVPLAVVGFNLGKFKMKEAKVAGKLGDDLTIDAYANLTLPDSFSQINHADDLPGSSMQDRPQEAALGTLDTTQTLAMQLSQGEVAARIYTSYFGQLPFARVALTQQYACNYGQSWPMLVYLPICGFLDQTQQHFLGLRPEDMYWKVVTAHEVAHQWWGQTVGFRSYRDQWMSEGFADESSSIFLQATRPKPDEFLEFWKEQRKLITEKNKMGFRPIDVGPVTMGFRLSTEKAGFDIYQDLVYPKGAYILHMVRMMMWTPQEGDKRFEEMMHDFLKSYWLKAATTEDFKAMVEKHMSPLMDLDGNHKMDWFFNEYVYGTDLPTYHFEGQVTQNGDANSLHFKLTQSGVPASFRMLVPIYLEFGDGKIIRLGAISIVGDSDVEKTVPLPKLPSPVKRVSINNNYDVLAIEK
jgi:hypothetical protein